MLACNPLKTANHGSVSKNFPILLNYMKTIASNHFQLLCFTGAIKTISHVDESGNST